MSCELCKNLTWEEEFDKLTVFSAPMPKDNNVHTFVVDIQEVKDFIKTLLSTTRNEVIKEIEEKLEQTIQEEKFSGALYALNKLKQLLNSMKI